MIATIKSIHLDNFKGVKDRVFDFNNVPSVVTGRNASCKTTIATAYMWLFTDKDLSLNSNPDVKPLGVEECTPTVTVVMNIDGKEIEFTKVQKNKKSKPDENGNYKISTSNSYLVNSIPLTERDFKAKLSELEFPTDNEFLLMSHVDVFTGMKQADQRKILFSMVDGITDKDVAEKTTGIDDLKALMDNYTIDEIEAMQKASKKKSDDELKNIPGQIEGLELAKTEDVDTAEYELQVNGIKEEISNREDTIRDLASKQNEKVEIGKELLRLDFDRSTELQNMEKAATSGRGEIEKAINRSCNELVDLKRRTSVIKAEISQTEQRVEKHNVRFADLKKKYEDLKGKTFDETSTVCPCCGQTYPAEKIAELKANFEKQNEQAKKDVNVEAKEVQKEIKELTSLIEQSKIHLTEAENSLANEEKHNADLNKQLENFKPTEVKPTERLVEIDSKIAELTAKKESMVDDYDSLIADEKAKLYDLKQQMDEINKLIGASSNNVRIDEQIEALSEKRIELEQAKADAEKILYQLSVFSQARNNMLTDEINKHFKKVRFQLFKFQKNGEYKEDCQILSLDGKPLGMSINSAMEMEMKMDICQAFQRYYDKHISLFIDGAELFSSDTCNRLECETQHIYLKVSDGELEINNYAEKN